MMRVNFPGLLVEKNRNGSVRYRVRMEGDKTKRIAIPVAPDHPMFGEYYHSARAGRVYAPEKPKEAVRRSLDWLTDGYLAHLGRLVEAGLASKLTLQQRKYQLRKLCDFAEGGERYGDYDMDAPTAAFVRVRDAFAATPAEADNMMKAARAMYTWAMEREEIRHNPLSGIAKIHRNRGGADAWTAEDLRRFRAAHPVGSMAHLWLSLHMFTACRISDAIWLGPQCERERDGLTWLEWQPVKKGSAPVSLPLMPPLRRAIDAVSQKGATYLLSPTGVPFSSTQSLRKRAGKWCETAGIKGKTPHGIRKAVAELLAEAGSSQHQIMAILAHTQAKTSEVYTKGVQRRILAEDAMQALGGLDW